MSERAYDERGNVRPADSRWLGDRNDESKSMPLADMVEHPEAEGAEVVDTTEPEAAESHKRTRQRKN